MTSQNPLPRSRFLISVILLGALFVVVRAIFFRQIQGTSLMTIPILDSEYYYHWAANLAWGRGHPIGPFWLSPFYAVFMAGLFKLFGSISPSIVVITQFVLSLATISIVALYTRKLFGDAAALWTVALGALYAPWVYFDGVLLSASLVLFLDAVLLWLLITRTDLAQTSEAVTVPRKDWIWIPLGIITAISALCRPSVLIFGGILVLWQILRFQSGWWRRVLFYAAAVAVVTSPAVIHNYSATGGLTLTTASGGVNFFIGNRNGASGIYDQLDFVKSFDAAREAEGYRAEASERVGRPLTLAQASRYWGMQAVEDIITDPGSWLRVVIRKLWFTVQREEIPNNMSFQGAMGFSLILGVLPLRWGLLFPLAAAGAWAAWRRRKDVRVLFGYAAAYGIVNLLFFSSSEYRFPMILALLPAAGCFFVELWKSIRERNSRALVQIAAVYIVALLVSNFPSPAVANTVKPFVVYHNMATIAKDRGMTLDAIGLYARSLAVEPKFQKARIGLANLLWKLGNYDEARQEFQIAGVAAPDSLSGTPMAMFLDELYQRTESDENESALALLDSVFPADRDAPLDIWTNRAMVEARLGHWEKAVEAMLKAQSKDPASPEWSHKAARLALAGRDTLRADSLFRNSLAKYAAYAPARLELGLLALARKDTAAAKIQLDELKRIRIPDDSLRYKVRDFALRLNENYDVWKIGQQE